MSTPQKDFDQDQAPFQEEWLSAYLDNELSSEQRLIVEERVSHDPRVRLVLEDLKKIRGLVSSLPGWEGPTPAISWPSPRNDADTESELDRVEDLLDNAVKEPESGVAPPSTQLDAATPSTLVGELPAEAPPPSGLDRVEEVIAQNAVTESPVTESPVTESPVTESPVTESPVTESPVTESPVTESPVTESPVTESPVTESPVTEAESLRKELPEDVETKLSDGTNAEVASSGFSSEPLEAKEESAEVKKDSAAHEGVPFEPETVVTGERKSILSASWIHPLAVAASVIALMGIGYYLMLPQTMDWLTATRTAMLEASQEQADKGDAELSGSALGENLGMANQSTDLESASADESTSVEAVPVPADLPAFPALSRDALQPDFEDREEIGDAIRLEPPTESASAGMRAFEQMPVAGIPGAEEQDTFNEKTTGLAMQGSRQSGRSASESVREGMDVDAESDIALGRASLFGDPTPSEKSLSPTGDVQSDRIELKLDDIEMNSKNSAPGLADALEAELSPLGNDVELGASEPANQKFGLSGRNLESKAGTMQTTLSRSISGIYIARSAAWTDDEVRWGLAHATKLLGRPIVVEPAMNQPPTSAVTPLNKSSGKSSGRAPVVIANIEAEEARDIIEKVVPELTGFTHPDLLAHWSDQVNRDDPRQHLREQNSGSQSGTVLKAGKRDEVRPSESIDLIALFVTRSEAESVLKAANQRGAAWITNSNHSVADAEASAPAIVLLNPRSN